MLFPIEFCCLMTLFGYSVKEVIQSLAQSQLLAVSGAKSQACFFRTLDNQFLVKTLSPGEMSFLGSFLPKYFTHMLLQPETHFIKILGACTVTVESEHINYTHRCLVMENLTFGLGEFETYDLKGSLRNRWLESSNVKLDANYRLAAIENRVIFTFKDKRKFIEQLKTDSAFLSSAKIMDYSLVAIVSRTEAKVRIGIVDFCGSYTIDKALESMVKKTPLYSDHAVAPTVISPSDYQDIFVKAMDAYFLASPVYSDTVF
jgi:1-phosphatidylinositol-3-phosphate 5-kinase